MSRVRGVSRPPDQGRRSRSLQERFGREYDRTVDKAGGRREAEQEDGWIVLKVNSLVDEVLIDAVLAQMTDELLELSSDRPPSRRR